MLRHVKKHHSEAAKQKADEFAELTRMQLLHANKVPRLSVEDQDSGAASTRSMKKDLERVEADLNPVKQGEQQTAKRKLQDDDVDMSHMMDDG